MNVLITSNMYPNKHSCFGIFVKHQVEGLEHIGIEIIKVAKNKKRWYTYVPFVFKSIFYVLFRSYDLVHAHYGFHSGLLPALLKRKPLIVTYHRGDALDEPLRNKVYFWLQRFTVFRADFLIAVSNDIREALVKSLGADPRKISIIPCGVDTELFHPLDKARKQKELGIPENSKVVLFIGELTKRKGVDLLLKCAERIREAHFIFIGEGEVKANYENCYFVGPKPNHVLPKWINIADIFALPSRSEGTPVVVLEALSCGIPVVASKVGGIPDLIHDGVTGYLVEPEDVDMFEKRLRELLENPEKRRQMGLLGRKHMIENYDSRRIAERIKQVYERVLDKYTLNIGVT